MHMLDTVARKLQVFLQYNMREREKKKAQNTLTLSITSAGSIVFLKNEHPTSTFLKTGTLLLCPLTEEKHYQTVKLHEEFLTCIGGFINKKKNSNIISTETQ